MVCLAHFKFLPLLPDGKNSFAARQKKFYRTAKKFYGTAKTNFPYGKNGKSQIIAMHSQQLAASSVRHFILGQHKMPSRRLCYTTVKRHSKRKREVELAVAVRNILGPMWVTDKIEDNEGLHFVLRPNFTPQLDTHETEHAQVLLWSARKEGQSQRSTQYWRTLLGLHARPRVVAQQRALLSEPAVTTWPFANDDNNPYITAGCDLVKKSLLMAKAKAPPSPQFGLVRLGIFVDGTNLWKRRYQHFSIGFLGTQDPLGSWVLARGPEKAGVLKGLCKEGHLNDQVRAMGNLKVRDDAGWDRDVLGFRIANSKAHVALSGCKKFTCKKNF